MTTPAVVRLYDRFSRLPGGKRLFANAVCWRAPYFRTIRPTVLTLKAGESVWFMRKRRAVHNHIGTVHALAVGNLCELAAGMLMEASLPPGRRWIPKGMTIEYLRKAETDLTATARLTPEQAAATGDIPVEVLVTDTRGEVVTRALISMYVSERRPQAVAA